MTSFWSDLLADRSPEPQAVFVRGSEGCLGSLPRLPISSGLPLSRNRGTCPLEQRFLSRREPCQESAPPVRWMRHKSRFSGREKSQMASFFLGNAGHHGQSQIVNLDSPEQVPLTLAWATSSEHKSSVQFPGRYSAKSPPIPNPKVHLALLQPNRLKSSVVCWPSERPTASHPVVCLPLSFSLVPLHCLLGASSSRTHSVVTFQAPVNIPVSGEQCRGHSLSHSSHVVVTSVRPSHGRR
ncbi:uncharacterized protein BJX67DRAFT_214942 [Aspergillus lucknowensis]|uniref:Uncharacterized protein n=1 Tax=Aspergillus lucknowensis TaxID=176173 RepID=A0ABR4M3C3_9EURO